MYCKYCGREIKEGEVCSCHTQNDSVKESGSHKSKPGSDYHRKEKKKAGEAQTLSKQEERQLE